MRVRVRVRVCSHRKFSKEGLFQNGGGGASRMWGLYLPLPATSFFGAPFSFFFSRENDYQVSPCGALEIEIEIENSLEMES